MHKDNRHFFRRNAFFLELLEVIVDAGKGEVDGSESFVVHADADEDFDLDGFAMLVAIVLGHLLELVDQAILDVEFPQVVAVGAGQIEYLADVVGLDWPGISAHRDALVIDPLLEDAGREEDVERWVLQPAGVVAEDWLHFHLHLYFKCS